MGGLINIPSPPAYWKALSPYVVVGKLDRLLRDRRLAVEHLQALVSDLESDPTSCATVKAMHRNLLTQASAGVRQLEADLAAANDTAAAHYA